MSKLACPNCGVWLPVRFGTGRFPEPKRRFTLFPQCTNRDCRMVIVVGTHGGWDHGFCIGVPDQLVQGADWETYVAELAAERRVA